MNNKVSCILAFIVLLSCSIYISSCSRKSDTIPITGTKGCVEEIIDGSTIKLANGLEVNLIGITPSVVAEKYLKKHLLDEYVTLISDSEDPVQTYTRGSRGPVNAYVIVDDDDLLNSVNGRMVRIGFAEKDGSVVIDSIFQEDDPIPPVQTDEELLTRLKASTFTVITKDGQGTGFYISSKGLALTNAHVLSPSNVNSAKIYPFTDDGKYDSNNYRTISRILECGNENEVPTDYTIFEVNMNGSYAHFLNLAKTKELDGKKVVKLGCTLGMPAHYGIGNVSHTTDGVVTHSININHGDSGSPLINERGQVIGVNRGGLADPSGGSATSVNFAVDIQLIKKWLDEHPDLDEGLLYGK